ncbi:MAG: hypothetical protein RXO22_01210 [Thermocladium sp.]|nr:MAG: hypothetical protein AT710_03635 [Thermocladium sp. ECH_B]
MACDFDKVIIVTENWEINYNKLLNACKQLGNKCIMLDLSSNDGLDMLLQHGVEDLMAKIPLILIKRGNNYHKLSVEDFLRLVQVT